MPYVISENTAAQRFETVVHGEQCVLEYSIDGNVMAITHTGVPGPVGGRGIAAALVQRACDSARERKMLVEPRCSYAEVWMRRHPEYADLVHDAG